MNDKFYKILGVGESASDEEVRAAYLALKSKYEEERFLEGEKGNEAAKRLTEVEVAYNAIVDSRSQQYGSDKTGSLYNEVEELLKKGDVNGAQQKLDEFDERSAEWHYFQSVVFYKKNWINESKKQLEIAITMEPDVEKYKKALNKMNENVNGANAKANEQSARRDNTYKSGNVNQNGEQPIYGEEQQLGGNGCMEWCCQMLACNLLLNCCCNCG